ncbi:hypothetical protein [Deinococcus aquaticus]|uniref:hypothetical protein n=1 Tax=Deinococcus aquaticus TaxID=328692 RepID=UPI003F48DABB
MHITYKDNAQDGDESVADIQQRIETLRARLLVIQNRLSELRVLTPVHRETLLSDTWLQEVHTTYNRSAQATVTAQSSWQRLNAFLETQPTLYTMAVTLPVSALPAVKQSLQRLANARQLEQAKQRLDILTPQEDYLQELLELANLAYGASARVRSLEQAVPAATKSLGGLLGRLLSGYVGTSAGERETLERARRNEEMASERLQNRVLSAGYDGSVSPEALSTQIMQVRAEQDTLMRQLQLTPQQDLTRRAQEGEDRVKEAWADATRACAETAKSFFLPKDPSIWEAFQDAAEVVLPLIDGWHQAQHLAQQHRGELTSQYPGWFAVPNPLERAAELARLAHAEAPLERELETALQHLETLQALSGTPEPVDPEPATARRAPHELLPWTEDATVVRHVTAPVLASLPVTLRSTLFPGLLPWVLLPSGPETKEEENNERAQAYPSEVLRQASLWGRRYGWRDGNHLLLAEVLHHLRWSQEEEDLEAALVIGLSPECLRPVQLLRTTWKDESQNHEVWRQRPNYRLGSYWDSDDTEWYAEVLPRRLTWADATQLVLQHWRHLSQDHPDELCEDDLASIYDQLTEDLSELRAEFQDLPFDEKIAVGSFHHYLMDPPRSAR